MSELEPLTRPSVSSFKVSKVSSDPLLTFYYGIAEKYRATDFKILLIFTLSLNSSTVK
jgi:hypothetical protein